MPDQIRIYRGDRIETIALDPKEELSFGDGSRCRYQFPKGSCGGNSVRFIFQDHTWNAVCQGTVLRAGKPVGTAAAEDGDIFVLNAGSHLAVQFFKERQGAGTDVPFRGMPELLLGRGGSCSVQLSDRRVSGNHAKMYPMNGAWRICDLNSTNGTYVNGRRVSEAALREGDIVTIGPYEITFTSECLRISGGSPGTILPHLPSSRVKPRASVQYPVFSRSPRLVRERPSGKLEIEAAPNIGSKPEINWLTVLLPVLGTLAVSLLMTVFTAGMGMMLSVPMMLVGIAVTFLNYRTQSKKFAQTETALREKYRQYLRSCEQRLEDAARRQREAVLDANPSPAQCREMAERTDRRLWERTPSDGDFLSLRVGLGQEPLGVEIQTPKVGFVLQENDFTRLPQQTADRYGTVEGIPVLCGLLHTPSLGLVGDRGSTLRMAQALLVQAAAHHGYDDLKLAVFFPQEEQKQWEWVRWLPHTFDGSRSRRLIACTRYEAAEVFAGLEPLFRRRSAEQQGTWGKASPQLPHYLFVIADPSLLQGQPAADYLLRNDPGFGVSCVLLGRGLQDLPGSVAQILEARGNESLLYRRERPDEKRRFQMDQISPAECEAFARALAPIRLPEKSEAGKLPDSVAFLEGYGVRRPEELDFADYWNNSCSWQSLSVPIGVKAGGAVFSFDIHEKKSGPHGLVAGTNGSGKSEMAQSWIASMAVQFSPRDVNFVLVDFKGTSLLQPFRELPHLAGSISNLDKDIQRCLMALDNEIERRQLLVDRYGAHDILGYQARRRTNPDMEEMPFLILVIDEFADFKAQYPDFTGPLDHIFRGGRALGIYTVIMTQKPAGVVTEQMTANANFRWCLKVMSESDSREMLGINDAAYLNKPGRSYVKIGTGVPELVQPFYSGAPYYPDGKRRKPAPAVARVSLNGERQPVVGLPQKSAGPAKGTQLQAVVQAIASYCRQNGIAPARQVWTEPLPEKLDLSRLLPGGRLWDKAADWAESPQSPTAYLGLTDDPANQCQTVAVHRFWTDGHLLAYGMPLSGKTTFLQTLLVSLCSCYTPGQVQLYLMELGGFGLRGLEKFPHVGSAAGDEEPEKLRKILDLFLEELERRKQLFRRAGAGSIAAFSDAGEDVPPAWILAIDNLNLASDKFPELLEAVEQISREGEAFGLYLAATVTGSSGLGYRLTQNFKTVVTLQLADKLDYAQLVGRVTGNIPKPVMGRGLVKGPLEFQTAIVWPELSDGKRTAGLRQLAEKMTAAWQGPLPPKIASMPREIPYGSVPGAPFVLGLSRKDVSPVRLPLGETTSILVSGGSESALEALLKLLLSQAEETEGAAILLCSPALTCAGAEIVRDPAQLNRALDPLAAELKARQAAYRDDPSRRFPPILILLDGLTPFMEASEQYTASRLEAFIRLGEGLGLTIVGADTAANVEHSYFTQNILMETLHEGPILLAGGAAGEHRIVNTAALSREYPEPFGPDTLVLARNGEFLGIKQMKRKE